MMANISREKFKSPAIVFFARAYFATTTTINTAKTKPNAASCFGLLLVVVERVTARHVYLLIGRGSQTKKNETKLN